MMITSPAGHSMLHNFKFIRHLKKSFCALKQQFKCLSVAYLWVKAVASLDNDGMDWVVLLLLELVGPFLRFSRLFLSTSDSRRLLWPNSCSILRATAACSRACLALCTSCERRVRHVCWLHTRDLLGATASCCLEGDGSEFVSLDELVEDASGREDSFRRQEATWRSFPSKPSPLLPTSFVAWCAGPCLSTAAVARVCTSSTSPVNLSKEREVLNEEKAVRNAGSFILMHRGRWIKYFKGHCSLTLPACWACPSMRLQPLAKWLKRQPVAAWDAHEPPRTETVTPSERCLQCADSWLFPEDIPAPSGEVLMATMANPCWSWQKKRTEPDYLILTLCTYIRNVKWRTFQLNVPFKTELVFKDTFYTYKVKYYFYLIDHEASRLELYSKSSS